MAVKAAWLAVDDDPAVFLGDSESYLATALKGWIPPDRSFVYGFVLRPFAVWTGSLAPVVYFQSLLAAASGVVLAWLLIRHFAIPAWLGFTVAVLWGATEPLALLLERYVLTETCALFVLALLVAVGCRYIASASVRWLIMANVLSTVLVSLRTVYIPVSISLAVILPLLARGSATTNQRQNAPGWRSTSLLIGLSLVTVFGFHQLYKVAFGQLARRPPAYQTANGLFLLATWSPLLIAEDFPDREKGRDVMRGASCASDGREAARWQPDCLIDALVKRSGSDYVANRIARATALNIVKRDPLGVMRLTIRTWKDYLSLELMRTAVHQDRPEDPLPARTVDLLRERFGVANVERLQSATRPTDRWFFANAAWYVFLSSSPLVALVALAIAQPGVRRPLFLVAAVIIVLLGATIAGSLRVSPRFLHPVAWLVTIPLAVLVSSLFERRRSLTI
ncbi:MAG TPA: hypothetical protein VJV77_06015 [Casimicrobiaceae bacterium]|nr:hypothetical protein [Casimicrobiaceae bacterium]